MAGRKTTKQDVQLAADRLKGSGAWQGNGLLVFLASTSRKDSQRKWMEPLRDVCERIVNGDEDGIEVVLSDEEAKAFDVLAQYSVDWHAAIDREDLPSSLVATAKK